MSTTPKVPGPGTAPAPQPPSTPVRPTSGPGFNSTLHQTPSPAVAAPAYVAGARPAHAPSPRAQTPMPLPPGSAGLIAPDLAPGEMCGEYQIEGVLGEGGMGKVYAAVHPVIGKQAAVKVLRQELCASAETVERFVQEARSVNQIGHPNIVDIFAFGALPDGRSYFVMEWLRGLSLADRLRASRLSREEFCDFATNIARALEAAHEKHIVHRDLKPDNVFLHVVRNERPVVKLLDFGIAKLNGGNDSRMERTRTGMMMGTPAYMAPEQARALAVDHRTDIYSFGVMLYEMLVGAPPFVAESAMDIIIMHISTMPVPPSQRGADVPAILDQIVMAMMAKEPADRPSLARVRDVLAEARLLPPGDAANTQPELAAYATSAGAAVALPRAPTNVGAMVPGAMPPTMIPEAAPAKRGRGALFAVAAVVVIGGGIAAAMVVRKASVTPVAPVAVVTPPATDAGSAALVVAPTTGTLVIEATNLPADVMATLTVDGKAKAPAQRWTLQVAPGPHTLELAAIGMQPLTQPVTVTAGGTATVAAALVPVPVATTEPVTAVKPTVKAKPTRVRPSKTPGDDDELMGPRRH